MFWVPAPRGRAFVRFLFFSFFSGSYLSPLLFLNVYGVWVWVGGVGWDVITSLCSTSPYSVHFSYGLFLYVLGVWVGVGGGGGMQSRLFALRLVFLISTL